MVGWDALRCSSKIGCVEEVDDGSPQGHFTGQVGVVATNNKFQMNPAVRWHEKIQFGLYVFVRKDGMC